MTSICSWIHPSAQDALCGRGRGECGRASAAAAAEPGGLPQACAASLGRAASASGHAGALRRAGLFRGVQASGCAHEARVTGEVTVTQRVDLRPGNGSSSLCHNSPRTAGRRLRHDPRSYQASSALSNSAAKSSASAIRGDSMLRQGVTNLLSHLPRNPHRRLRLWQGPEPFEEVGLCDRCRPVEIH